MIITSGATRAAACLTALLIAGACAGQSEVSETETEKIYVEGIAFSESDLTTQAGTTVTWVNRDDVPHTVTSGRGGEQGIPGVKSGTEAQPDGVFAGDLTEDGTSYSFTFEQPGTYRYYCEIHASMRGRVVVE